MIRLTNISGHSEARLQVLSLVTRWANYPHSFAVGKGAIRAFTTLSSWPSHIPSGRHDLTEHLAQVKTQRTS